ncbi:HAD-IA family hydrolase [Corynebacterium sp. S7]
MRTILDHALDIVLWDAGQVTTLLLDVDGTLIDSMPGIRAGFLHALDSVDWPHPDEKFLSRIAGPPMEETLRNLGLPRTAVRKAFNTYMEYTRDGGWANATAFPGMLDLVSTWSEENFRLITATSKGEGFARAILSREGFLDHFEFLGAAEEDGARRTKRAVIQYVFDNVDLEGEEILMVGDRHHDIEGAAHFGVDTAAVTWGYGEQAEWDTAQYVAHSPAELDKIVRNIDASH